MRESLTKSKEMVSDTRERVYLKRMPERREGLICGVKSLRKQK